MRFFDILNLQHVALYFFPALVFVILLWLALGFVHIRGKDSEAREKEIHATFPGGYSDKVAPFPLVAILIIVGVFVWALFYVLGYGLLGVKI
jgi:hypothetical protein